MNFNFLKRAGASVMASAMMMSSLAVMNFSSAVAVGETKYEFEKATFTGTVKSVSDEDASGGRVAYMTEDGTITVEVTAESTGMYEITIYALGLGGDKIQNLSINGVDQGQLGIPESDTYKPISLTVKLTEGKNTIEISKSWGWSKFDYMTVAPAELGAISASQTTCVDKDATAETQNLMSYLASVYGNNIISGQQEIYQYGPHGLETEFEYLYEKTGHYPAIRGFDYGNRCCVLFGQNDDGSTDRIIDWVKNKNGIATASFHLNVPNKFENYTLGSTLPFDQTTYSEKTDFSPSKACTEGTKENEYYLQALEVLAGDFKKLEAEGIPVLWRPLHEAEGGGGEKASWFWWGREGSEVYKKLWIYTYETLTEKFGCHNLIWVWNSYNYDSSANWYPGDEYVDIIGYDKYNCTDWSTGSPVLKHNDSAIASTFYGIMNKYNSTKMVAMAENDSFSTVENLISEKAGWLYFMTWYDGGGDSINFLTNPVFNTLEDTIEMYQSDYCITLDELPADLYSSEAKPPQTTTSTTGNGSTTTTTTTTTATGSGDFVFKPVKEKVDFDGSETLTFTVKGTAGASIGGAVGYGHTADDWVNIEWDSKIDKDGTATITVDVSEVPDDIKFGEVQIWWSNVWDAENEKGIDKPAEIVLGESETIIYGDVNGDKEVNISDAVAVMQFLANGKEYPLDESGIKSADVINDGGVTALDALAIQMVEMGAIDKSELPLSSDYSFNFE